MPKNGTLQQVLGQASADSSPPGCASVGNSPVNASCDVLGWVCMSWRTHAVIWARMGLMTGLLAMACLMAILAPDLRDADLFRTRSGLRLARCGV